MAKTDTAIPVTDWRNSMDKLLYDPIFRAETQQGLARLSLPSLLEALGNDEVESLHGLQRHQEDAFHIFLCYLAGAVLARALQTEPIQPETFWRDGLLALADGDENAWTLVVEDPTKPAFMQAPVPKKADFAAFKPKAETPDELDVLQVTKNHDVKAQRARAADAETWAYSLVSLQTMTGLMGRGNYGITRMNSGTGSRLRVGAIYDAGIGAQWKFDVAKLLSHRASLLDSPWRYKDSGTVLTWLIPWDLKTPLSLSHLDPFYIEIARAIRLVPFGDGFHALSAGSEGKRIYSGESKQEKGCQGNVGDPWTPIVNDGREIKAWTVMSRFSPKDLRDLMFGDDRLQMAFMQKPDAARASAAHFIKLSVLAPGGMGKTNGFHEAMVRIPGKAAGLMSKPCPERDRLASRSKESLARAGEMQNRVLKPAVFSLLEAGPEKINFDKREVSAWVDQAAKHYTETWADGFFPWLWRSIDQTDDNQARLDWLEHLRDIAWAVLQDAITRLPLRSGRSYRSRVRAEGVFYGCLYKQFDDLKPEKGESA
jgi:CRISPR system Cascade subunit CasA